MAEPREFYYPLQDKAADIDRVIHDLVGITEDSESVDNFVKVIDINGVPHFWYGGVSQGQTIDVDAQEIPIGDGENWVKKSDWYLQYSEGEQYTTEDPNYEISFYPKEQTLTYVITSIKVNDGLEEDLLNESFLSESLYAGTNPNDMMHPKSFTSTQLNQIINLVPSASSYLSDYNYYIGPDSFSYTNNISNSYFIKFYEENGKYKLAVNKFQVTSINSGGTYINTLIQVQFSNWPMFKFNIDLQNQILEIKTNTITRFDYSDKIKSKIDGVAKTAHTEAENLVLKEQDCAISETRYFGSQFTYPINCYYPAQLVFGSDPKGEVGFDNSCNLTLRGRAKIFADDSSYTHFAGNSFVKIEDNAKVIVRGDGDFLLQNHAQFILGNENSDAYRYALPSPDPFSSKAKLIHTNNGKFVVGENSFFDIENYGGLKIDGYASLVLEGNAWISMYDQSRVTLSGNSKIFMDSTLDSCSNRITTTNHCFDFISFFGDDVNYTEPNTAPAKDLRYLLNNSILPLYKKYYDKSDIPSITLTDAYSTADIVTRFQGEIRNSLVFIMVNNQSMSLNTLNDALQSILPEYKIGEYYILTETNVNTLEQYLANNPTIAAQLTDYTNRPYCYLTSEEYAILRTGPSAPYFNKTVSLQPFDAALDTSYNQVLDKLKYVNINKAPIFNFEYVTIGNKVFPFSRENKTIFTLRKVMTTARVKNMYTYTQIANIINNKDYYTVKNSDNTYSVSQGIINTLMKTNSYNFGTNFRISGPGTQVVIGDGSQYGDIVGRESILIAAAEDGFINFDITSGKESYTNLKFGANEKNISTGKKGKLELFITGDDAFVEVADNSHFEIHDNSNFILRGRILEEKFLTNGHRDEDWFEPYQNNSNTAPTLQLYQGSSLSMYGVLDSSYCFTKGVMPSAGFNINISLENLNSFAATENSYKAGAQALVDYLYNGSSTPATRNTSIFITDKTSALSLIDIIINLNTRLDSDSIQKIKTLTQIEKTLIEFVNANETYTNTKIPANTQKCQLKITGVTYTPATESCSFRFTIQNVLIGDNRDLRIVRQNNSPLIELAENAEFRMWEDTQFKMANAGITIKDNSVISPYTFTVDQLKTAIEDRGSGGTYSETILWDSQSSTDPQGTYTLSASISNFDAICFKDKWTYSEMSFIYTNIIPSSILEEEIDNGMPQISTACGDNQYLYISIINDTTLTLRDLKPDMTIEKIIGIKYGASGS